MKKLCLQADASAEGQRIDKYLAVELSDYSRSFLQKQLKEGNVTIGEKAVKSSYQLSEEEEITVLIPDNKEPDIEPENIPLSILYEDEHLAYLDTHYYGGIKKYQWVALPLALHGVVVKKDGTTVTLNIGDKPGDPVFYISDLLIHLAADQMGKTAAKVIEGDSLNIIIGSEPKKDTDKDPVKTAILDILKEQYGIDEEDFISAELEAVPAGHARDLGFDRSMIMATTTACARIRRWRLC